MMRATVICLLLLTIPLAIHCIKDNCQIKCGGHCEASDSDCADGEISTPDSFCSCDGVCCRKKTICELRCAGKCADLCSALLNPYIGQACSCDGSTGGKVCCADVCGMGDDDQTEPCVRDYHGICRPIEPFGCNSNENARLQNDLCTSSRNCICCKPKSPHGHQGGTGMADPRYVTLDNSTYHYDGKCTYTMMRECGDPKAHPWFIIYIEHTGDRVFYLGHEKTYVKGAIAEIDTKDGGKHIIHFMSHGHVKINDLPEIDMDDFAGWKDNTLGLRVEKYNQRLNITLDGYFSVSYNRKENVLVKLDETMGGKVCGLMGNGDGNPDNDFLILDQFSPSGLKMLKNPTQEEINIFGDSWVKPGSCPDTE